MDMRTGTIYQSAEDARAAGVPDDEMVTGTRPALEKLKRRLTFMTPVVKRPRKKAGRARMFRSLK